MATLRTDRAARAALILGVLAPAAGCTSREASVPVFCYRWLTDVTCYAEPHPDAEARLIGGYLEDPDDPGRATYWREFARARMSR